LYQYFNRTGGAATTTATAAAAGSSTQQGEARRSVQAGGSSDEPDGPDMQAQYTTLLGGFGYNYVILGRIECTRCGLSCRCSSLQ